MKGLSDTDPKIARMQLELLRHSSAARRFSLTASWSKMLMQASYRRIRERQKDERAAKLEWVRVQYGEDVARRLEKVL